MENISHEIVRRDTVASLSNVLLASLLNMSVAIQTTGCYHPPLAFLHKQTLKIFFSCPRCCHQNWQQADMSIPDKLHSRPGSCYDVYGVTRHSLLEYYH